MSIFTTPSHDDCHSITELWAQGKETNLCPLLFAGLQRCCIWCHLILKTALPGRSVQSLSCVRLFPTPWIPARQASLSITNSRIYLVDNSPISQLKRMKLREISEKAVAPHSSTLAWRIPRTEEPGRLQSMGSLRVGHDWETSLSLFTFMHWRRKWQPTPVFLPGESQERGSLVGCGLWGRTKSDTTEAT